MFGKSEVCSIAKTIIEAEKEEVFKFLLDPTNTPRWMDGVCYISHRPPGEVLIGSEVLCRVEALGLKNTAILKFQDVRFPTLLKMEGKSFGVHCNSIFELSDIENNLSTVITWYVELKLPPLFSIGEKIALSTLEADMNQKIQNLKHLLSKLD